MSSEDDIYILYESCEKGDEMPSKRGRKGRGRGVPPVRSPEYIPPGQESSQIGQGSGGRGRGKTGRTFSSFEEFQKAYGIRTAEESRDHPASMPSTSGYKKQQSGHKIAPEDIGLKFRDESHRSHAYQSEKSHDYEPSMSAAKEYRKPPVDIRFKEKPSDESYRSYNYPAGKSRDCKPSSVHGTSVRDYRRGHNVTSATFKNESHTHSSERSRDFESSTSDERSPDYESSTTDEEYRKGHTAASRDIGFKMKQDELHKYTDPSKRSRDYEPSISAKEYRKGHKAASEDSVLKIKRDDSYRSTIPAEISHDYEPCSVPSTSASKEYRKEHKVNPEDIGLKFKDKSSEALFPKRPGLGKEGRHIKVISNLYPIEFPTGCAYHYDVEVFDTNQRKQDPGHKKYQCLNTKKNREVISYMLHNSPVFKRVCGAFDGKKNLLTREKLNIDLPFSCSVMLPSEKLDKQGNPQSDNFKVEIKSLVSRINLDSINAFYQRQSNVLPQDAIMAIEIILRHGPCLKFTPIGRCFFFPPDVGSLTPFGGGLEIWFGYHQSIRLSQWCPTVNLDVSATTFWEAGPVIDYIAEYMNMSVSNLRNLRCLNRNQVRGINRKLKQRQIKVTHLSYGRRYRILRLRDISANQECIEIKDKRDNVTRMTVAQYFKETYRKDLEFGNLPCVQVQPEKKNIFMPIEVCEFLQGQHYKGDLTQAQRTKMIQFTSNPPHERFRKIQDIVQNKANFSKDKTAKGFGLEVSNRPLIADARVLDSPSLMYKDKFDSEKEILPRNGSWDVRGTQFVQAAKISSWVLISFQRDRNLDAFAAVLKDIGRNLGLKISDPSDIIIENANCDKERLFGNLKKRKIELAVIVIPYLDEREEKLLYAEIKKAAETVIGLATQCIKAERLKDMSRKRWPQIASNLCLKINAKLGGENHSLFQRDIPSILCKPVIIIGADVNHPAPTQPNQPSIAACVGSLDCFGKRFAVSIRAQVNSNAQKKKVEQILELENMVHDLLLEFYRHTRRQKPEKIIFYRDGVSEGELVAVKNEEVLSIRKACRRLDKEYKPGITVIVVQKRHHVRFKPSSREDGVGPKGNLPPGTVIDTEVTHPVNFDFFLCSQYGLQGTSRPSHYLVVEDDNKFTADDLQKLTFQMCHMYVRCTKSISIPAPVAYADLVAYRARKHLDCKRGDDSSSSDCSRSYRLTQEDIDAITVVDGLKDSMYFV